MFENYRRPLPQGVQLEQLAEHAFRDGSYVAERSSILDTKYAVDFLVTKCLRLYLPMPRQISVQVTCKLNDTAKFLNFAKKAKLLQPNAARVFVEVKELNRTLHFHRFPFIAALDRILADTDLQEENLFRLYIDGFHSRFEIIRSLSDFKRTVISTGSSSRGRSGRDTSRNRAGARQTATQDSPQQENPQQDAPRQAAPRHAPPRREPDARVRTGRPVARPVVARGRPRSDENFEEPAEAPRSPRGRRTRGAETAERNDVSAENPRTTRGRGRGRSRQDSASSENLHDSPKLRDSQEPSDDNFARSESPEREKRPVRGRGRGRARSNAPVAGDDESEERVSRVRSRTSRDRVAEDRGDATDDDAPRSRRRRRSQSDEASTRPEPALDSAKSSTESSMGDDAEWLISGGRSAEELAREQKPAASVGASNANTEVSSAPQGRQLRRGSALGRKRHLRPGEEVSEEDTDENSPETPEKRTSTEKRQPAATRRPQTQSSDFGDWGSTTDESPADGAEASDDSISDIVARRRAASSNSGSAKVKLSSRKSRKDAGSAADPFDFETASADDKPKVSKRVQPEVENTTPKSSGETAKIKRAPRKSIAKTVADDGFGFDFGDEQEGDAPAAETLAKKTSKRKRSVKKSSEEASAETETSTGPSDQSEPSLENSESKAKVSKKKSKASGDRKPSGEKRATALLRVWNLNPDKASQEFGLAYDEDGQEYYCHQRSFADRENLTAFREIVEQSSSGSPEVFINIPISFRAGRRRKTDGRLSALDVAADEVK